MKEWMEHRIKDWIKRRKESLNKVLFSKRQHPSQMEQGISVYSLTPDTSEDIQMDSFEQEKEELNQEEKKVGGTLNLNQNYKRSPKKDKKK